MIDIRFTDRAFVSVLPECSKVKEVSWSSITDATREFVCRAKCRKWKVEGENGKWKMGKIDSVQKMKEEEEEEERYDSKQY